jgi:hypothetical protein
MNTEAMNRILGAVTDLKYSEWRALVDMVERQFRAEQFGLRLTQTHTEKIVDRLHAERPELFE